MIVDVNADVHRMGRREVDVALKSRQAGAWIHVARQQRWKEPHCTLPQVNEKVQPYR